MKVAVYAISKNELPQVQRFMDSINAAGLPVYVLDHSTDGTAEALKARGAHVDTTPVLPWSWDAGKNAALALVPDDFDWCISLDLDEVLNKETGEIIKAIWPESTRVCHLSKLDGDVDRLTEHYRLHRRHGYSWQWPVHEFLVPKKGCPDRVQYIPMSLITHWPTKGKKHTATEGLLKAVAAMPTDARMRMLCGRDLYFDGRHREALDHFNIFLGLQDASPFEKSYVLVMMGRCYQKLGDKDREMESYERAVKAAPRRESVVAIAHAYLSRGQYGDALLAAEYAMTIKDHRYAAGNDPGAWSFKPLEIASIAAYRMKDLEAAIEYTEEALSEATAEVDKNRISEHLEISKKKMQEILEFEQLTA